MTARHTAAGFDHRDPGTPEEVWLNAVEWQGVPLLRLAAADGSPCARVVVVAAHPDDETLGAAGLIAAADRAGIDVEVVVATDGEHSHPGSPTYSPDELAALRKVEVRRAVADLHPGAVVTLLGLPDGQLTAHVDGLAAALQPLVLAQTLIVAPWRGDRHPDHEAAGRVSAAVAERAGARSLEFPIWLWHWGTPAIAPWHRMSRLCLGPAEITAKTPAVQRHATQIAPLSNRPGDEVLIAPHVLTHFLRGFETFIDPREELR